MGTTRESFLTKLLLDWRLKIKNKFELLKNRPILDILDGDTNFENKIFSDGTSIEIKMPYLSGPILCEISNKFGLPVSYGENGITLSRWMYLFNLIDHCILNNSCSDLLAYFFDIRSFHRLLSGMTDKDVKRAHEVIVESIIDQINGILYFSKNKLIKQGNNFFITEVDEKIKMESPQIQSIDSQYIKDIYNRAITDIDKGDFDSAITKSRTLLEEVFCYVIQKKNEIPSDKGDIQKLFKQVRDLYNMHTDGYVDKRIKSLISGLNNIVNSVGEMRNKTSDSHGLGNKRISIEDHHTRLVVNSSIAMSEFILSVEEKQSFNKS